MLQMATLVSFSTGAILVESAFYYFIHWQTEEIKQNINK